MGTIFPPHIKEPPAPAELGGYTPGPRQAAAERPGEPRKADPKQEQGWKKTPFRLIPWVVIYEAALAFLEGAIKYGPLNWRQSDVLESTYIEGAMRHITEYVEGRTIDHDSGVHSITKAIASLMILRDAQINGTAIDDRPPSPPPGFLVEMQGKLTSVRRTAEAARARIDKEKSNDPTHPIQPG